MAELEGELALAFRFSGSTDKWLEHARPGVWLPPPDVWHPLVAAHRVAEGGIGRMYAPDPYFVAGPLFAISLAPARRWPRTASTSA